MMTNTSNIGKERSDSEASSTLDPARKKPRLESDASLAQDGPGDCQPGVLVHGVHALAVSNTEPSLGQDLEKRHIALSGPTDQLVYQSRLADQHEEIVITAIRATDVALGLRRLPAGFFAVLHHSGLEWRTENKPSSGNQDIVEWDGPIRISSDMLATICLEVYASFEFEPMLGSGEQLRKLVVTVKQLLEHSQADSPFVFYPKDGDVMSPCTSLFITVKRQKRKSADPSASKVLGPHWSTPEAQSELENATNSGHSALLRYRKQGEKQDLEQAIREFEHALNLSSMDHPCRGVTLSNLAMVYLICFQVEDGDARLAAALRMYHDALALRPVGHPDRLSILIHTAAAHLVRCENRKYGADEEQAQTLLREVLGSRSIGSHAKQAASILQSQRPRRNVDLMEPNLQPAVDTDLGNLSVRLLQRFERLGDLADLQQAIAILQELVRSTSIWDNRYLASLQNLGVAFRKRFERLGKLADLEDAISRLSQAVDLAPRGHSYRPGLLNNLSNSCLTRFWRLGEVSDLEHAISRSRDAVGLTPHGHPDKPVYLSNLGNSLKTRFLRLGEVSDLEDAISRLGDAVDLIPHGHPDQPSLLNSLGTSLITRFERLGEVSDLEDAISRLRDAANLTAHGHPDRPSLLNSLGTSLITRFERLGSVSDLEDAIAKLRDAADLASHGHPDQPARLNNLGGSFLARFERFGEISDLENAISRLRDAVDLTPHGHPNKPVRLNNLGTSLKARFERLGEVGDLEDAVSRLRDAVDFTPHGHPNQPSLLNSFGTSLTTRFERFGEASDLEDAISRLRDAVNLTPHGHPDQPGRLSNLGGSLKTRFELLGEVSDLEDAISRLRDAVHLTPHGHPDRPARFSNLGTSLVTRFERLGEVSDLEDAISRLRDAVHLTPHGHPDKPDRLFNLGMSFAACFERLGECKLQEAISMFSCAASSPIGPITHRFRASQQWISCARRISHPSLLHAYSVALHLIPQLAWIGLSLMHRYQQLTRAAEIVPEAAAAALDAGFPIVAVEWLEQGRSIVWGELFQLRSSYEDLSAAHPDHARRLRELSAELDQTSTNREISSEATRTPRTIESLRQLMDRQRRLAIERDKLLQDIRRLPGFEQFLRRKRFSQLRAAAHAGPVVILNAAETRSDALIVLADLDHVIHVPLTKFTYKQSAGLQHIMKDFVREARVGGRATLSAVSWEYILSSLWTTVVRPVLDAVAFSEPRDLSRIFWCPTGPFTFLPIHAAGLYGTQYSRPGHKLSDFHISSYVPTLSTLALSPGPSPCTIPINNLRILAVRQPPSDGLRPLSGVGPELEHIRKVIEKSPAAQTIFVESSQGTVEEVLRLMKGADWVHFACHGVQDAADPTQSGLCLANERRLALRDIIALKRPHGGLAFLSACETAKGDVHLSEEATHIAAGMLFAGYGGVIGTLWTISDRLAPEVAKNVYEYLFRDGKRPDYRDAARALHEAIGRARREGASFSKWIPFIHLGL